MQPKAKGGNISRNKPDAHGFDAEGNLVSPGATTKLGPDPEELLRSMERGPEDGEFEAISRPTPSGRVETEFPVSRSRENIAETKKDGTVLGAAARGPQGMGTAGGLTPEPGSVQQENIKRQIKVWSLSLSYLAAVLHHVPTYVVQLLNPPACEHGNPPVCDTPLIPDLKEWRSPPHHWWEIT